MSRKLFLFPLIYLPFFFQFLHAQSIQEAINRFVASSGLQNATISLQIADVDSKEVLGQFNGSQLAAPASTTKLFSTAYALEHLGGEFQPKTELYYHGEIQDSVLLGNIWIIGGGDMSLGSKYFFENNKTGFLVDWAAAIKNLGIKQIDGAIYADGSNFGYEGTPSDWLWGDIGNYYGAHFSGLMVYDNILELHFKTRSVGSIAQLAYTFPVVDSLNFTSKIRASKRLGDNSYIYGAAYDLNREGRGELPQNHADFTVKGSLPDPEKQLAVEFSKALVSYGIVHKGIATSTRIHTHARPQDQWNKILDYKGVALKEIVKATNFESINVFAEGLMRVAAQQKNGKGLHDEAVSDMQGFWREQLNVSDLFLEDGSGLARTNAISAKSMSDLLIFMNASKNAADFYNSLPISGENGTMKNVAKNQLAHGKIHAKSGTMRRTKSYAGYAETASGKKLAFAIIVNHYSCSNRQIVSYMENLMNEMVKL